MVHQGEDNIAEVVGIVSLQGPFEQLTQVEPPG